MAYLVIAPQIVAYDMGGNALYYLRDQLIPWLSPKAKAHLITMGLVEEVPDLLPPGVAEDVPLAEVLPAAPSDSPDRPAPTAPKDKWVAYVVGTRAATQAEAEALTRDQLIQLAAG
ncbi:hypothetical protein [Nocardia sp. NPDC046763]|uniref:hypothetical protein n=1 Tax=Nocardia sp. NPDC046763 TaxID=3155256 RepID=UPI0033E38197